MKALSLTQPWASLIASGAKKVETRSWQTKYRGPLVIHASKGFPKWARDLTTDPEEEFFAEALANVERPLPLGQLLCVVDLVAITTTSNMEKALLDAKRRGSDWIRAIIKTKTGEGYAFHTDPEPELDFGDYGLNRFAWILQNPRLIEPVDFKGQLQLYEVPDDLIRFVEPAAVSA